MGWFEKGMMVPEFETPAFALKEKQISNVVKTAFGYHIIKLTGIRAAGVRPFADVREQVKTAILPTMQQEAFQEIKKDLKSRIKYTVNEKAIEVLKGY